MSADSPATDRRALFIVITDYPGGAERVTFSLAAELASRPGWEVEVKIVCAQLPDSFSARTLPPNVRVSYGAARNWFLAFPLLPFRLLFRRYDLVFTTHIYTNALLSILRRWRLIKIGRLIVRESTSIFDRSKGWRRRLFGRLYRAYGGEDLVIAQTGYMADHVRPWLPARSAERIRVLPNPVDVAAIEGAATQPVDPEIKSRLDGRTNVLFCGRLIPVKRPELALEAFHLAAMANPDLQLVYVGDGELEQDVRAKAAERHLADRVLFLGFKSNPFPIMAACRYGLVTSEKEGFPNAVLEMMACGMQRIVVTPCAGDLDRLDDVEVTTTFNPEELGNALRNAIDSGQSCSEAYRACARARSVQAYLGEILASAGSTSHRKPAENA